MLNNVLFNAPRSGIRLITELALSNFEPKDIIFLGYGQPDLPMDGRINSYIQEACGLLIHKYTLNKGLTALREAIVKDLTIYNANLNIEDVFITCGATHAVTAAVGCLVNTGDEVLVPDPGYPNYPLAVQHYGGTPVFYPLKLENNFVPDIRDIKARFTDRTRAIIINFPSNPTGAVVDDCFLNELTSLCERNKVWLISDEVYSKLTYGKVHSSPLNTKSPCVISINSFSKNYNMCGFRVGYVVAIDKAFQVAMLNSQELYISCSSFVGQYVAYRALQSLDDYVCDSRQKYLNRIKAASAALKDHLVYEPQGAFYILLDISSCKMSSVDFCIRLLEKEHVAISPGICFGPSSDKYVRISLIADEPTITEGINRIIRFIGDNST